MIAALTAAQQRAIVEKLGEHTIHRATELVEEAGGGAKDLMDVLGTVGRKLAPWDGKQ